MSTHLTIKTENRPNPSENRDARKAPFSLVLVAGDMICFVVRVKTYEKGSVKQTNDVLTMH